MFEPNESERTVKDDVREKYDAIARGMQESGYCMTDKDAYGNQTGYCSDADLGLGCGTPVDHAELQPGETVLDLGSGAGLDVLIASPLVGDTGKVIGVDITPTMVAKATENADTVGISNVTFLEGDIEDLPIEDGSVDVVISNCTLNLVPDKKKAISEIARVLRPRGRMVISDVMTLVDLPPDVRSVLEQHVGCINGAPNMSDFFLMVSEAEFKTPDLLDMRFLQVFDEHDGFASLTFSAIRKP